MVYGILCIRLKRAFQGKEGICEGDLGKRKKVL